MFWATLQRAFTSRQNSSAGSSRPPGKPPGKPPEKPPEKPSAKPSGKPPEKPPEKPQGKSPEKPQGKSPEKPQGKSPEKPSGKPPAGPSGKPPGAPSGKPSAPKEPCKVRMHCHPAQFCKETDRFRSMWDPPKNLPPPYPFIVRRSNELCCEPNCTKPLPSFDELYYRPTCKDGPFQRTWVECPNFIIRKKVICAYDKLEALEPARRVAKKRERPSKAPFTTGACPHLAPLARCNPGRRPPRCHKAKTPSCCRKLCAPMPSWSECKQPPLAPRRERPRECECRNPISPCEVERGRQYIKLHGPNYVCPKDVRWAKKQKKERLKKLTSKKKKESPKKKGSKKKESSKKKASKKNEKKKK